MPIQVNQNSKSLASLGAYSAGYLPALTSIANWASDIATGGNVTQANPFNEIGAGNAALANKTLGYTTNLGAALSQESQAFGGFGGIGVTGSGASGGSGGTTTTTTGGGGTFPSTPVVIPGTNNGLMGFLGAPVTANLTTLL